MGVTDDNSTSSHLVTLSGADWDRVELGYLVPEMFVKPASRSSSSESPERILTSVTPSQISGYFPDFERPIASSAKD